MLPCWLNQLAAAAEATWHLRRPLCTGLGHSAKPVPVAIHCLPYRGADRLSGRTRKVVVLGSFVELPEGPQVIKPVVGNGFAYRSSRVPQSALQAP